MIVYYTWLVYSENSICVIYMKKKICEKYLVYDNTIILLLDTDPFRNKLVKSILINLLSCTDESVGLFFWLLH